MYREPSVDAGIVYTTWNYRVLALDALTGQLRWQHAMAGMGNPALLPRAGRLYLLLWGRVDALDGATGAVLWTRALPVDRGQKERLEALGDGLICSVDSHVIALAAEDGAIRWSARAYGWVVEP